MKRRDRIVRVKKCYNQNQVKMETHERYRKVKRHSTGEAITKR